MFIEPTTRTHFTPPTANELEDQPPAETVVTAGGDRLAQRYAMARLLARRNSTQGSPAELNVTWRSS